MSDFWSSVAEDATALHEEELLTKARIAAADVWSVLATAADSIDLGNRRFLVAARLDAVVAAVAVTDDDYAWLRPAVEGSFIEDWKSLRGAQRKTSSEQNYSMVVEDGTVETTLVDDEAVGYYGVVLVNGDNVGYVQATPSGWYVGINASGTGEVFPTVEEGLNWAGEFLGLHMGARRAASLRTAADENPFAKSDDDTDSSDDDTSDDDCADDSSDDEVDDSDDDVTVNVDTDEDDDDEDPKTARRKAAYVRASSRRTAGLYDTAQKVLDEGFYAAGGEIDQFTASAVVQVMDHLNEENRAKIEAMPLQKAIDVIWKLVKKAQGSKHTLHDGDTGEELGAATDAQVNASDESGPEGFILIDADGTVVHPGTWDADQPGVHRVYTVGSRKKAHRKNAGVDSDWLTDVELADSFIPPIAQMRDIARQFLDGNVSKSYFDHAYGLVYGATALGNSGYDSTTQAQWLFSQAPGNDRMDSTSATRKKAQASPGEVAWITQEPNEEEGVYRVVGTTPDGNYAEFVGDDISIATYLRDTYRYDDSFVEQVMDNYGLGYDGYEDSPQRMGSVDRRNHRKATRKKAQASPGEVAWITQEPKSQAHRPGAGDHPRYDDSDVYRVVGTTPDGNYAEFVGDEISIATYLRDTYRYDDSFVEQVMEEYGLDFGGYEDTDQRMGSVDRRNHRKAARLNRQASFTEEQVQKEYDSFHRERRTRKASVTGRRRPFSRSKTADDAYRAEYAAESAAEYAAEIAAEEEFAAEMAEYDALNAPRNASRKTALPLDERDNMDPAVIDAKLAIYDWAWQQFEAGAGLGEVVERVITNPQMRNLFYPVPAQDLVRKVHEDWAFATKVGRRQAANPYMPDKSNPYMAPSVPDPAMAPASPEAIPPETGDQAGPPDNSVAPEALPVTMNASGTIRPRARKQKRRVKR